MKKALATILVTLLFTTSVNADFSEKIRPYIEEYLGDDIAIQLFGEKEEAIQLPAIPKVNKDARTVRPELKSKKSTISKDKIEKSNLSFLYEIYKATRQTKPNDDEVSRWMNVMSQGGSREGVYRALVLDNTYAGRENYDSPVTDGTIKFVQNYLADFLEKSIKKESLEKINFYTLKRVITEQTLEVLDELSYTNIEDFYSWYAVFSAEMAKKYPNKFENKIRKSTSRERHMKWAKFVPVQHVKSEIMIKLHTLFNASNQ